MTAVQLLKRHKIARPGWFAKRQPRRVSGNECDANAGVCPVSELRASLAREAGLLRERDALIEHQATLSRESDHRLLNNLQMVSSLLSLQSRTAANPETVAALTLAANRVATIGRIHAHLHSSDGCQRIAFKSFLETLCRDFRLMLAIEGCAAQAIVVEGIELELPTSIGIPLGFVVNELITNALKYGAGVIAIRLARHPLKGFALSVENGGSAALPEDFNPADSKGLGMRIIRSFVAKVGGELKIGRGEDDRGARFTVLFAAA